MSFVSPESSWSIPTSISSGLVVVPVRVSSLLIKLFLVVEIGNYASSGISSTITGFVIALGDSNYSSKPLAIFSCSAVTSSS